MRETEKERKKRENIGKRSLSSLLPGRLSYDDASGAVSCTAASGVPFSSAGGVLLSARAAAGCVCSRRFESSVRWACSARHSFSSLDSCDTA